MAEAGLGTAAFGAASPPPEAGAQSPEEVLCELQVLPAELEPAWERERLQQSPSAAVLAPGQGLEWKAAKAQAPSALPVPVRVGCCRGADWGGNVTLRRPELNN